uniref:Uncharacterized protein n=1 Tax=Chrysotila carterae TaxID=13221 RepID=A0A7S4F845_CHRCT
MSASAATARSGPRRLMEAQVAAVMVVVVAMAVELKAAKAILAVKMLTPLSVTPRRRLPGAEGTTVKGRLQWKEKLARAMFWIKLCWRNNSDLRKAVVIRVKQ